MICQLNPGIVLGASRKDPLSVAEGLPVLAVHPSPVLLRMPSTRPTLEAGEEGCRETGEGAFTHLGGVVATPAANDWVEMSDQSGLGSRAVGPHDLSQLLAVAFNLVLSGFDECFEAERCASTMPRLVFTNWVLPHLKSEEVEPGLPFVGIERMGNPGFLRFQP